MKRMEEILASRLKKKETQSKMEEMVRKSSQGELTSFSGIFHTVELTEGEKLKLEEILSVHAGDGENISEDLKRLSSITSEVKAITTQAILLHGERIKKAQDLLKRYKEGAFTAWLIATYGNRQTPYNFLQYYEFVERIPPQLKMQVDKMPKQAVYTLASRNGPQEMKEKLVLEWKGESKENLLRAIREMFPLSETDKRAASPADGVISSLQKTLQQLKRGVRLKEKEKNVILALVESIREVVED
ncbi:CT583 family protein [Estrella lausannensis]|uniref:Virulence plasmid protein-D-related protein n=1 Tax=Estrella lausannensis TaxID=483423 RepID=A0A0H5DN45_9BACT|nr:CT583 family protein [Estrella lausannensis]CRX37502.1 Virulence plasmid protein-D-related protein [Estrella lausannensis]